ncbi:MAG: universal stress protein [Humibacillus sp.]|nr:universal stress protein [Humibacillus sp.]MDN5779470.1 universal stress protein [Humibacillus sp.]
MTPENEADTNPETRLETSPEQAPSADQRPIVVGIDGSQESRRALRWACEQAHPRGCGVLAVAVWHVYPLTSADRVGSSPWWFTTDPDIATQTFLEDVVAPVAGDFPDVMISRVVRSGRAPEELARLSHLAQMIVVGAKGRGGVAGMLLGSTSRDVLERASCTVIVVR